MSDRSPHDFCGSDIFFGCGSLYKCAVGFYWMQFSCIPKMVLFMILVSRRQRREPLVWCLALLFFFIICPIRCCLD
jgi:hypothetical protein